MMQRTFKHLKKVCFINLLFAILFLTLGQASSAELKKGTGTFLIETAVKTAELKKGTGTFLIETPVKTADSKSKSLKVAPPEATFKSSIHTDTVKIPTATAIDLKSVGLVFKANNCVCLNIAKLIEINLSGKNLADQFPVR